MSDDAFIRRENLKRLRLAPAELVQRAGRTPAFWSDLLRGRKSFGEKLARSIEESLGMPRLHLDSAIGESVPDADALQAHSLSHPEPIVDPQAVTWEWILNVAKDELPWRFVVPMPDASLAGEVEKGAELVFQVGYPPRIGKPVLVEHRATGRRYIRLYAEAPEGWRAIATTEAFLSFDSSLHEVDILAAMRWRD